MAQVFSGWLGRSGGSFLDGKTTAAWGIWKTILGVMWSQSSRFVFIFGCDKLHPIFWMLRKTFQKLASN